MAKNITLKAKLQGAEKTKQGLKGIDGGLKRLGIQATIAAGAFIALKKSFDLSIELKNFARDAEETKNKFKTVFSSMENVAIKTARTLADSFGMAHTTAMELLGDTGDILVGFGFTERSALELSKKVNELSVDLASFTNFAGGASGASKALTKAILGETESAKSLGIVLRQGTSEFKDQVEILQKTEGMTYNQAMATVLLNDAYKQSSKAIGDFARTQDQLANKERILEERLKGLKEELGRELLPVFQKITSVSLDFVESINIKTLQDFARSMSGIAISIGLYNSAMVTARLRTIQFQATLIKTGWGAVIVGAGLAIGKLMEMAGVFSTVEANVAGLNKEMKALAERSFAQLTSNEQKEKIIETKKELMEMFEEGTQGAKDFQSFLNSTSMAINKQGLTAAEAESIYTAAVKAGVAVRKGAKETETDAFEEFLAKQQTLVDLKAQEAEWLDVIKEMYPELAEAMGLVNEKQDESEIKLNNTINTANLLTSALQEAFDPRITGGEGFKGFIIQLMSLFQGVILASKAVSEALTFTFTGPLGVTTAIASIVALEAAKALVRDAQFAKGGDFITSGPQMMLVGDNPGGRERVQVTPLSSPNVNGPSPSVTLNISGNVMTEEFTRDQIIPEIQKATRLNLA